MRSPSTRPRRRRRRRRCAHFDDVDRHSAPLDAIGAIINQSIVMATTMTTTTTTTMTHPRRGVASRAPTRTTRTRARARIDSKDPWWEKPCPENMKECESTMEFLNLLVRPQTRGARRRGCACACASKRARWRGVGRTDDDDFSFVLFARARRTSTATRWSSWTCTRDGAARAERCIQS